MVSTKRKQWLFHKLNGYYYVHQIFDSVDDFIQLK